MTLGDESIIYARANYVKLFHQFNPNKFEVPFDMVRDFDHVKHRNVINTYHIAVRKIKAHDPVTKSLKASCNSLAAFSKNLVDQAYPRAVSHNSDYKASSNQFFSEINQIVKFDHNIGVFDNNLPSFKQLVNTYQGAIAKYKRIYKLELVSSE